MPDLGPLPMTISLEHLDKLIAAVKATGDDAEELMIGVARAIAEAIGQADAIGASMLGAYNRSLDAAESVHEALLPGWVWMMGNKGTATVIPPERLFAETGLVGPTCRVDSNPARAWLLSILRALKAQGERG